MDDTNPGMRHVTPESGERIARAMAGWREHRLREAGFPARMAHRLARDGRFDIHALIELTERGCPPHLAERIAEPLDPVGARPC